MAHTQHWSAGLESWMIDVPCVRREIHARSTHPQKDTGGDGTHGHTDHTDEPHNHPSQPSRPTTAHKHDRATTDEPGADRTSVGTHASPQTRNHRTPLTLKRQGGAGSQVPVRRLGGRGSRDTHTIQARVLESPIASYLQEIFRQSVKLPKTPINSNAQDANAVASLRRGSSIGLEAS